MGESRRLPSRTAMGGGQNRDSLRSDFLQPHGLPPDAGASVIRIPSRSPSHAPGKLPSRIGSQRIAAIE
jgi:hypothetical protein